MRVTPPPSVEPEATRLLDGRGGVVELFLAVPQVRPPRRSALLIVHGHQFPERPGGRGRLTSPLIADLAANGWITAALSQPGYGGSTGPPDCCGPRTQAALRLALDHLVRRGADLARTVVWGVSRGAVAASCAFVDGAAAPAVLILQAGVYDMEGWVRWVRRGAPGGDAELARAILANQEREAGLDREALRARSGLVHATRGRCDVLVVHGAGDPQAPARDLDLFLSTLRRAGRRAEVVIAQEAGHRLPPHHALHALAERWPELGI